MIHVLIVLLSGGAGLLGYFITFVVLCCLVGLIGSLIRSGKDLVTSIENNPAHNSYSSEQMTAVSFQLSNFIYFRKLSSGGKNEFIKRVMNFIETHSIEGEDDFDPSLPDKIHVAAAATQLTFGFEDFMFTHFETVILYPGIFRLREEGPLMKGATTPNGEVRISIRDFDEGYANPSDKLNVGLHEFGHALLMEIMKLAHDGEDENLYEALRHYLPICDRMINSGKHADTFLRDYAFTNRQEFFAVTGEHFFEAPEEFREKLPELYEAYKNVVRQDPASGKMDHGIIRVAELIAEN